MEQVFESVKDIEKQIAGFISQDEKTAEAVMIENAAVALEKYVRKACSKTKSRVTVLCGSGNNGADGYTLCRRLAGSCRLNVIKVKNPKSFHCISASDNLINVFQATSSDIYFYDLNLMQGSTSVEKVISKSDVVVELSPNLLTPALIPVPTVLSPIYPLVYAFHKIDLYNFDASLLLNPSSIKYASSI